MKSSTLQGTNILVAMRISSATNSKRRPPWFTKDSCVLSVIGAVEKFRRSGGSACMVLLVDISSGMRLNDVTQQYGPRFDQVIGVRGGSAARSWRSSIRALDSAGLLESAELLYFVEDDHLHVPDALTRLIAGSADYRFVYASDEDRARTAPETANAGWVSVGSGVTSFAVTSDVFQRDRWKHMIMSYGGRGWDELTFRALGSGAHDLLGGGWRYTLAPLGLSNSARQSLGSVRHTAFRAAAQVIGKLAPKTSIEAMTPPGAAHAEFGKLPGGIDWAQVAGNVSVMEENAVASE